MSILIKLTPDFSKIWKGWSHIKVFGTGNLSYCSKPPSPPPSRLQTYFKEYFIRLLEPIRLLFTSFPGLWLAGFSLQRIEQDS